MISPPDEQVRNAELSPPTTLKERDTAGETLRRIERLLVEIRGRLETLNRAQQHRHFSAARMIGAVLQMVTVAFLLAAVVDWVYQSPSATQIIKLLFAGVVQVCALTAFVMARGE